MATAAVAIPILIVLILVGGPAYVAAVAVALAVAAAEFQRPHFGWRHPMTLLAAAIVAAMAVGAARSAEWVLWIAFGAVLGTLAASLLRFDADRWLSGWLWTIGGIMYVGLLGASLVLLREFPDGRDWVFLALFSTFTVDAFAYFTGRFLGRHKLAPAISPKKTIEGFAGGYAAGFAAVVLLNWLLDLDLETWRAIALGLALPVAATIGDLAESAMKRSMRIKDSSELIPGHGGVLDRLDSVLFTFTIVYLAARWWAL